MQWLLPLYSNCRSYSVNTTHGNSVKFKSRPVWDDLMKLVFILFWVSLWFLVAIKENSHKDMPIPVVCLIYSTRVK